MNGFSSDVAAVEVRDISVAYGGREVLRVPSLQVFPNEVLAIIGPNGSGKTTLLLCLALLHKPATGKISFGGQLVTDNGGILRQRRKMAVVFQESLLLSGTVWDNVTLGLMLRKTPAAETEARARKWMERFGIWELAKRQAGTLSGGEAKRASLARAFVLQPDILLLDEPFSALDGPTHQSLIEDFESVLRETKVCTVLVTHDRNEALVLGDRVAVVMDGAIAQIGRPEEVFGSPVNEEVAAFVQAGNILHGVVERQGDGLASINVNGTPIHVLSDKPAGSRVVAFINYEDITVSLPSAEMPASSARNQLRGKITRVFPFGYQVKVTADCGFPLVAVVTNRSAEELGLAVGKEVVTSFKASSIRLVS